MSKMQKELETTKQNLADANSKLAAQQQDCSAHGYKYYIVKQKYANERKARIADHDKFKQEMAVKDATITALHQALQQVQPSQPHYNQQILPNLPFSTIPMGNYPQIPAISAPKFVHSSFTQSTSFSGLKQVDSDESIELPPNFSRT